MPTMADISVLNKAGASVVYVAKVPSAGDKTPARWVLDAAHSIQGFRPTFTVGTRNNGSQNARVFELNGSFPIIQTINAVDSVAAKMTMQVTATLPTNADSTKVSDGYVQMSNAMVSVLLRAVADSGYAPT